MIDALDQRIIDELQGGFPLCRRPFAIAASRVGTNERTLIERVDKLLADGILSGFGPLYNAGALGGASMVVALHVPERDFDRIAEIVNGYPEVAHNYKRDHHFNMWFVLVVEKPECLDWVIGDIEDRTGLKTHAEPETGEFFSDREMQAT